MTTKLFGDQEGNVKPWLTRLEGITYQSDPLMFFINLARYKFAARHIKPTDRVLDAGCGVGTGSVMLKAFAQTVVGVDVDAELIHQAQTQYATPGLTFQRHDLVTDGPVLIDKPQQQIYGYDVVVCLDVVEHFTPHNVVRVIQMLTASLKLGGVAIIGTPNKASAPYASARRKASHPVEYDAQTFAQLLENASSTGFIRHHIYAMNDEVVSTGFLPMAWYLMAVCWL